MDRTTASNRVAWDVANRKYAEDPGAVDGAGLAPIEVELLAPLLSRRPRIVHLQSGNGTDCVDLLDAGAASAVGVDFSVVGVRAATDRARSSGSLARYVVGTVPHVPLADAVADVVYTGKGALVWLDDLTMWAAEVARLLAPGGRLFVYDEHPAAPLWTRDPDRVGVVPGRSYFGGTRVNDTFPASAIARFGNGEQATEWQWTIADVVSAVLGAGLLLEHLGEHAEPFWRPQDGSPAAAAWGGALPNSFTLLASRPAATTSRA